MYRDIVSVVLRNSDNIQTDTREIALNNAPIMCIIGLPSLAHEEAIGRLYRFNERISTIWLTTWIVPISDIFDVFRMVDDDWINSTSLEPAIDHIKIIIPISWMPTMMILSLKCCKFDIPIMCCHIETTVVTIESKSQWRPCSIIPREPGIPHTIHVNSRDGFLCDWENYRWFWGKSIDW